MKITRIQLKEVIRKIVERKLNEISSEHPANEPIHSEYGYIMPDSKANSDDPRVQLNGYGNMPLSAWKKKVISELEETVRYAKQGNFKAIQYLLGTRRLKSQYGSVMSNTINLIVDLDKSELQESAPIPSNMVGRPTQPSNPNPEDPIQQRCADGAETGLTEDSTMTTTQTTNSSTNGADQSSDSTNTTATPSTTPAAPAMTQADQLALASAQKDQQSLVAQRDKYTGAIKKLQEPVRLKVADIQRRLAPVEQKLGRATQKITDINAKYQATS
jgi:hypothetical protein